MRERSTRILAAIVAIGANVTYGIWIARASRNPDVLPFTLQGIKLIDDRIANPAYGALLITGLVMVFSLRLSLTTPWLLTASVLYVLVVLVGLLGYTPYPAAADRSTGPRRLRLAHLPSSRTSREDAGRDVGGSNDRHRLSNDSETKPMGVTLQR